MRNIKTVIRNILIFILLIVITFVIIFNSHNFENTINIILNAKTIYIIMGIISMCLYFVFEAINIKSIVGILGKKISILKSIKYSLIGFFFSGITPAASGGQPMEIYYMNKEDVPVSYSTLALLVHLCSFQIITICCGVIGAIINRQLLSDGFIWVFIIGVSLNSLALTAMLIGLFSPKFARSILNLFVKILKLFRYKNVNETEEKIDKVLNDYSIGAKFIKKHKIIFIRTLIVAMMQVIVYYSIPFFVYMALGLHGYSWLEIVFIQAMLFISVSSIPLPGSVGVSESAFLTIYSTIFGTDKLASAMLLNRVTNFYLFIIIGAFVVTYNMIRLNNKRKD